MSDLERLRTHPRRHAPPHRYDAIVATARRRRRRVLAGTAGGTAALAGLLTALVVTGGGANESLRIETPAGHPTQPAVSSGSAPGASAAPRTGAAPTAVEQPRTAVAGVPAPRSMDAHQSQTEGRQARSRPMKRTTYNGYTVCGGIASQPNPTVPRYCGDVVADRTSAGTVEFGLRGILDAASANSSSFTFDTAQEVDLTLSRGGRVIWRWSQGQVFAQTRHSLVVKPGGGYRWTTSWQPTDQYGRALPKGDYEVIGTIRARELNAGNAWQTTLTL